MTPSEINLLQSISRGKKVIECGACVGGSTIEIAKVADVISIDRHRGYGPPTFNLFQANTSRYSHRIKPIIADIKEALPRQVGDVVLIDLLGDYISTATALSLVPKGVRMVAVHDVGRPYCKGVDLAIRKSNWTPIAQADTLVILGRD